VAFVLSKTHLSACGMLSLKMYVVVCRGIVQNVVQVGKEIVLVDGNDNPGAGIFHQIPVVVLPVILLGCAQAGKRHKNRVHLICQR